MTIDQPAPVTDVLSFHCQQAAEKFLKMYLVRYGVNPKRTHDIGFLVGECCRFDPAFETLFDVSFLSVYAVESRYVDDFFIPSIEELGNAYTAALKVRDFILARIKE
ncbi:MAG: HEPN domain-containing protein [Candidatus Marinimicrobia bacterium]|nr:HEPN domain-containing protein [Candidatus Neomarinimicrobiota bacterium]